MIVLSSAILGLTLATSAVAAEQTVSLGYAYGKVSSLGDLNGVNLQYRYEFNDTWGVVASGTYMSGNKNRTDAEWDIIQENHQQKYYSLALGPSYRINSKLSVYGLLGFARLKDDYNDAWWNYQSGSYVKTGENRYNASHTSLAYGLGVAFNPTRNLVLNFGYEGSRVKVPYADYSQGYAEQTSKNKTMNSFNIGLGYRF